MMYHDVFRSVQNTLPGLIKDDNSLFGFLFGPVAPTTHFRITKSLRLRTNRYIPVVVGITRVRESMFRGKSVHIHDTANTGVGIIGRVIWR